MRPTYSNLIGHWYRPKPRYPELLPRQVYVQRVYYDYPREFPWSPKPKDEIKVPNKYIEFQYYWEDRWITDRWVWYKFLTHYERMD